MNIPGSLRVERAPSRVRTRLLLGGVVALLGCSSTTPHTAASPGDETDAGPSASLDAGADGSIAATVTIDAGVAPPNGINFAYALAKDAHTSAGVFNSDGVLVRTLWSNVLQVAGQYVRTWDGKDDAITNVDGKLVVGKDLSAAGGTYTIKVLENNVTYTWDGVIGNSEHAWSTATDIWDETGYVPNAVRLAFIGGNAWVATGYNEGYYNLFYFNTTTPNYPTVSNSAWHNVGVDFADIDADGSNIYLAAPIVQVGVPSESFVAKFKVSGTTATPDTTFGHALTTNYWADAGIDATDDGDTDLPVSIAVQNDPGTTLAVGHASGAITYFDKGTGAKLTPTTSIGATPGFMGFTSKGLWVAAGSSVYLVTNPGTTNASTSQPLTSKITAPVALATSKAKDHVYVLDGGMTQQVKEFDVNDALVSTYGTAGGFNDGDPTIPDPHSGNTKLMFDTTAMAAAGEAVTTNGSWIKVDPTTNEVWFCDCGTGGRILHVASTGAVAGGNPSVMTYKDQILFGNERYSVGVDLTDATRVFGTQGIEYQVEYVDPSVVSAAPTLSPADPSDPAYTGTLHWKMVRNWNVGVKASDGTSRAPFSNFSIGEVMTFPAGVQMDNGVIGNGSTYGYVLDHNKVEHEVEFPPPVNGKQPPMRLTGTQTAPCTNSAPPCYSSGEYTMMYDGDILQKTNWHTTGTQRTISLYRTPLTNFSSANDPVRATPNYVDTTKAITPSSAHPTVAVINYDSVVNTDASPQGWGMYISYAPTTDGVFALYDTGTSGGGFNGASVKGSNTVNVLSIDSNLTPLVGMAVFQTNNYFPPHTYVTGWTPATAPQTGGTLTMSNAAFETTTASAGSPFQLLVDGYPHLSGGKAAPPGQTALSSYSFQTNREGQIEGCKPNFDGTWPSMCFSVYNTADTAYGGHEGIGSQTLGTNIFATYDGQYAAFGNDYYHYASDGLMIGEYGGMATNVPGFFACPQCQAQWAFGKPHPAGAAGNIAQTRFVYYNPKNTGGNSDIYYQPNAPHPGDIYMYMSTESGFTPIQRWRISNLQSVVEVKASTTFGSSVSLK